MIVASLMAVACVDTQILPNDKTVEEDFWKSKSDVQSLSGHAQRERHSASDNLGRAAL